MIFEKNDEIINYLTTYGKVVLNACPGSGKTTTIAYKLSNLIKKWNAIHAGIACLSFTNTAKDQINEKYFEFCNNIIQYPHLASTIDSFINKYLTLPHTNLVLSTERRFKILDDQETLDSILRNDWNLKKKFNNFLWKYPPSSVEFSVTGNLYSTISASADPDYLKAVKKSQLNVGILKSSDSEFLAFKILNKYPRIGQWLNYRFPYLIIDEAQDTSEIQFAIFDKLIELGLKNIELVGDPYQSLYEWRDAKPDLFIKKTQDTETWKTKSLTLNRRSTQRIIDAFSILRNSSDPKISSEPTDQLPLPLFVYKYPSDNEGAIIQAFIDKCLELGYKNFKIVVRGKSLKNKLTNSSDNIKPWNESIPYLLIDCIHELKLGKTKAAVDNIRHGLIRFLYPKKDYVQQRELEQELKVNNSFNALLYNTLKNHPSLELSIKEWTKQSELLLARNFGLEKIDFSPKKKSSKYFQTSSFENKMVSTFRFQASTSQTLISTIHQVKGKTLEALLLILNSKIHRENILFTDIESATDFPSEKQRMIYVAMSRPKYFLALGVPNNISDDSIKNKFGLDTEIINC